MVKPWWGLRGNHSLAFRQRKMSLQQWIPRQKYAANQGLKESWLENTWTQQMIGVTGHADSTRSVQGWTYKAYYVPYCIWFARNRNKFLVAFPRNALGCQFLFAWPGGYDVKVMSHTSRCLRCGLDEGSFEILRQNDQNSHQLMGHMPSYLAAISCFWWSIRAHGGLSRHAGGGVGKSPIVGCFKGWWFTVLWTLYLYQSL